MNHFFIAYRNFTRSAIFYVSMHIVQNSSNRFVENLREAKSVTVYENGIHYACFFATEIQYCLLRLANYINVHIMFRMRTAN